MSHQNAPYKVSEPVGAIVSQIAKLINRILINIWAGNTTIQQLDLFLDWFLDMSAEGREEMFTHLDEEALSHLKILTEGKSLNLSALNGLKLICNAHWFSYIDSDFEVYTERGQPTALVPILIYEVSEEGVNFGRLFGSLPGGIDGACLTQHQILNFVSQYRPWLQSDGGLTCFLFKNNAALHVACIEQVNSGNLKIFTDYLVNAPLWNKERPPRLVVPQQGS
jgi:hypothetical protein